MGCHFLLQGIFLTQGSNPGLLHCRRFLYRLSHQGSFLSQMHHKSDDEGALQLITSELSVHTGGWRRIKWTWRGKWKMSCRVCAQWVQILSAKWGTWVFSSSEQDRQWGKDGIRFAFIKEGYWCHRSRLEAWWEVSWWSPWEVMGASTDLGVVSGAEVWGHSGGNKFVLVWKWVMWKRVWVVWSLDFSLHWRIGGGAVLWRRSRFGN